MPKLNLNVSVLSEDALEIGWDNEKLNGPTGVKKSTPTPTELLIVLCSLAVELWSTPQIFAASIKNEKSVFSNEGKIWGNVVDRLSVVT